MAKKQLLVPGDVLSELSPGNEGEVGHINARRKELRQRFSKAAKSEDKEALREEIDESIRDENQLRAKIRTDRQNTLIAVEDRLREELELSVDDVLPQGYCEADREWQIAKRELDRAPGLLELTTAE